MRVAVVVAQNYDNPCLSATGLTDRPLGIACPTSNAINTAVKRTHHTSTNTETARILTFLFANRSDFQS
jgi:hypothetical protein